ncbi:type IV pilus minor pilin PilW [Geotalea daltonii FRC-32]|uniref:Type IV pilus minor pilin PilW n=1 Tax=Geotalea daltonii (strain DSM 22248 / JCM 15807 / FRC-32) TaxID=316067 RepID=B9M3J6_GEODF|nr:prepilin-type N-terminal cleavage/methylation domain-containing protein [Geotalea daltonii]ACM21417.1 type IV pilus minor pilin PilW [Geotalea daltonii FRC-32]
MPNKKGYTLVELLVVMAIFITVIMISSSAFEKITQTAGQQSRSVETQIEGQVGLNLMRFDIEHAGYGLPWSFRSPLTYPEVDVTAGFLADGIDSNSFNDMVSLGPDKIPKAIASATSTTTGIDYLVVKSTMASINATSKKWSFVNYSVNESGGIATNESYIKQWSTLSDNFVNGENVVTLINITNQKAGTIDRQLANDGAAFYYSYAGLFPATDAYKPVTPSQIFTVYGIDDKPLRMPYNRADFYVNRPSNVPSSCNPGTGVLYKGVAVHTTGGFVQYPLLDCVGDMQVAFELDLLNDGNITYAKNLDGYTAKTIRESLKRVRVYILAHEGGRDRNFIYPVNDTSKALVVGDPAFTVSFGRIWSAADLAARFGPDWQNYRWKIYTLAIKPTNLD